MNFSNKVFTFL